MITKIWCNYNAISRQEMARAILFGNANPDEFKPMFVWNGTQYYKRIK
jgi:hypothetical protein